jgi:hypothetical protein
MQIFDTKSIFPILNLRISKKILNFKVKKKRIDVDLFKRIKVYFFFRMKAVVLTTSIIIMITIIVGLGVFVGLIPLLLSHFKKVNSSNSHSLVCATTPKLITESLFSYF